MKEDTLKLKKGGIDTIIAYIVVMLPLLYVVIYMVATIYHFSVQTYMNQVVKEATMMASSYGRVTNEHAGYINNKLVDILGKEDDKAKCTITYYCRPFAADEDEAKKLGCKEGVVGPLMGGYSSPAEMDSAMNSLLDRTVSKADIIGIKVVSKDPSILHSVTTFEIFNSTDDPYVDREDDLMYSAYKEEIIRNERPE